MLDIGPSLGMLAAIVMPFFNIPLIWRIWKRKSSQDISLVWAVGVWICILGMLPSGLSSFDPVLKVFTIVNTIFFTGVLAVVLAFHPKRKAL